MLTTHNKVQIKRKRKLSLVQHKKHKIGKKVRGSCHRRHDHSIGDQKHPLRDYLEFKKQQQDQQVDQQKQPKWKISLKIPKDYSSSYHRWINGPQQQRKLYQEQLGKPAGRYGLRRRRVSGSTATGRDSSFRIFKRNRQHNVKGGPQQQQQQQQKPHHYHHRVSSKAPQGELPDLSKLLHDHQPGLQQQLKLIKSINDVPAIIKTNDDNGPVLDQSQNTKKDSMMGFALSSNIDQSTRKNDSDNIASKEHVSEVKDTATDSAPPHKKGGCVKILPFILPVSVRKVGKTLEVRLIKNRDGLTHFSSQVTSGVDLTSPTIQQDPPPSAAPHELKTVVGKKRELVDPKNDDHQDLNGSGGPPSKLAKVTHGAPLLAGRYLFTRKIEGTNLYRCIDVKSKQFLVCGLTASPCNKLLTAHLRLGLHPHINQLKSVIQMKDRTFVFFGNSQDDLLSHIRKVKRMTEFEARNLFRQMCTIVKSCHERGIVLRDLKLRKFVFDDVERKHLKFESLEDAVVLDDPNNDLLEEKRGCPVYVAPEILKANRTYYGKAADMWSLGVILYTMVVGRYPFNHNEHAGLFAKISRGEFIMPESLSPKLRCLIRSLLRHEPEERLTSEDIFYHPWLTGDDINDVQLSPTDQCVPEFNFNANLNIEA